jgi:predicted nucleic acid-binding protein
MSARRATYLDASAIVKLAVAERESTALRRYLSRRRPLVSSALSRTEVLRALLPIGAEAARRAHEVLTRIDLARVNDRILLAAGTLAPAEMRSLDAIHLATALDLGSDLARVITYDERMAGAAQTLGLTVASPS